MNQFQDIDKLLLDEINQKLREMYHFEDLDKNTFEEIRKERFKHKNIKILILGVGGPGIKIVDNWFNNNPHKEILYGCISYTDYNFEALKIPIKYDLYYPGKEFGHSRPPKGIFESTYNHYFENAINEAAIRGLLYPSTLKLIIVQSFGGFSSYLITKWICKKAIELNVSVTVFGSIPFLWETINNRERAMKQICSIEESRVKVVKLDAEHLFYIYKDINFWNCFSFLDKAMEEKLVNICLEYMFSKG